jgi:hypothetical protein
MKKSLWSLPVLAAVLIVAGSGSALAIPSLGGPTGIASCPNALVAPMNEVQTALTYQSLEADSVGMYATPEDFTVWTLQALTGVSSEAELWAAYTSVQNTEDFHAWGLGGKLQVAGDDAPGSPMVAVGAGYASWQDMMSSVGMYSSSCDADVWNAYIVATMDLTPDSGESWEWSSGGGTQVLGSAGVMYINMDPDVGDGDSLTRPFVGVEFIGPEGTCLGMEYRWPDDNLDCKAVFSAVLTHPLSPALTGQIGTTNAGPGGLGLDDQDFFIRLGYDIAYGQPGW